MSRFIAAAGLLAVPALMLVAAAPAEAKIVCVKGYQIVNGSPIATPYCQDTLVAQVAREHGYKVSDAAVLNNPNTKRNVCQFVGRDIRLTTACVDANSQGRRF
jgi:ABC-type sugar transport system substrate-binding protein